MRWMASWKSREGEGACAAETTAKSTGTPTSNRSLFAGLPAMRRGSPALHRVMAHELWRAGVSPPAKDSSCCPPSAGSVRLRRGRGCQVQVNHCERLSSRPRSAAVSADELVALAVDGEDVARGCGVRMHLLATLQNVGMHGARRRGRVVAPDLIEHSVACHDLPAAAQEEAQDVELLVGELNGGSFAGGLALLEINLHLSEAVLGHSLPEPRRMPPQAYADAGHQLAQGERLCDVVVSPDLEAEDPVDFLPLGGEHDDRRFDPLAAQLPAYVQAAHARQHDVQEDQVRVLLDGE